VAVYTLKGILSQSVIVKIGALSVPYSTQPSGIQPVVPYARIYTFFSGRKPLPCPPPASTGLNPPACATMRAARAGVAIVRQSAYAWGGGMKKQERLRIPVS